jgi:hypothetical protein
MSSHVLPEQIQDHLVFGACAAECLLLIAEDGVEIGKALVLNTLTGNWHRCSSLMIRLTSVLIYVCWKMQCSLPGGFILH